MPYSGKNTAGDYAKVIPNAATVVVNGAISLLYMAGDFVNGSATALQIGELPPSGASRF